MSNTPPEQSNVSQAQILSVETILNEKDNEGEKKKRSMEEIEDDIIDIDMQIRDLKKKSIFIFFLNIYLFSLGR